MTVAVGLDVGTTGVKALAVTPSGDSRWHEQSTDIRFPRRIRDGRSRIPKTGGVPPRRRSRRSPPATKSSESGSPGQMHGLVALDDGDRPLRPAILWNDQRTAAECEAIEAQRRPRTPDRADGQPSASRLHRSEAPLAPSPRARQLRPHLANLPAQGLRAPPSHRLVGDRRRRRLGNVALRRRRASLEPRSRRRARDPRAVAPARSRVTGRLRRDGHRHPGRGGRR